jgi:catechol 2,3-dioxygenase
MAIRVRNVGHVVLKVRDIERSARFYRDVLGLKEVARGEFGRPMAFFSTGDNHHDVAVMEMGPDAPAPPAEGTGLYHVVSQSIYVDDPDGNMIELYVDADPSTWREKPETVASSRPLSL